MWNYAELWWNKLKCTIDKLLCWKTFFTSTVNKWQRSYFYQILIVLIWLIKLMWYWVQDNTKHPDSTARYILATKSNVERLFDKNQYFCQGWTNRRQSRANRAQCCQFGRLCRRFVRLFAYSCTCWSSDVISVKWQRSRHTILNSVTKNKHPSLLTGTSNDMKKIFSRHLWK